MFSPPKNMLVDDFTYRKYEGVDRNHIPAYGEKTDIEYVRIDRSTVYTRDGSEATKRADATIYCYGAHTEPFPAFVTQSKVSFDDEDYTITDVRSFTDPFSGTITAYELEVIR